MDEILGKISSNIKKKQTLPICANGQRMCIPVFLHDFIEASKGEEKKPLNKIGERASLLYSHCSNKDEIREAFITSCLIEMLPNFPRGAFFKKTPKLKRREISLQSGGKVKLNNALCFFYEMSPATYKGELVNLQRFVELVKKEANRHIMTVGDKKLELIIQESLVHYLKKVKRTIRNE